MAPRELKTVAFARDAGVPARGMVGDEDLALADVVIRLDAAGTVTSVDLRQIARDPAIDTWSGRPVSDLLDPLGGDLVAGAIHAVLRSGRASPRMQVRLPLGDEPGGRPFAAVLVAREEGAALACIDLAPLADAVGRGDRLQAALDAESDASRSVEGLFRALLANLDSAIALVDVQSGRILDLSRPAARLLGVAVDGQAGGLGGAAFTQCFEGRRRSEFIDRLCSVAAAGGRGAIVGDLRSGRGKVRIVPALARANGERILMCHLAMEGVADPTDDLLELARRSSDAMVSIDASGAIRRANDSFLDLVSAISQEALRARPLTDFLLRGAIDLAAMTDPGRARSFATQAVGVNGQKTPVEITVTDLPDAGFGLVLRDVSTSLVSRAASEIPKAKAVDALASGATALVGSVSLRDIVAAMTDDIEKDCIAAAVDLTQNNRVAAAEMLGLSRQSLYVKLRKHGLLDRADD